jgi:hypothetical protein
VGLNVGPVEEESLLAEFGGKGWEAEPSFDTFNCLRLAGAVVEDDRFRLELSGTASVVSGAVRDSGCSTSCGSSPSLLTSLVSPPA